MDDPIHKMVASLVEEQEKRVMVKNNMAKNKEAATEEANREAVESSPSKESHGSIDKKPRDLLFRQNADFVEKPRQVIAGIILFIALYFAGRGLTPEATTGEVLDCGLWTLYAVTVVYGVLNLRDSYTMVRPHPLWWRWHHSTMLFYLYLLLRT